MSLSEWDLYDVVVNEWLNGVRWNYKVKSVPDEDLLTGARSVVAYLLDDDDVEETKPDGM
jgi:hypothetical protein